MESKRTDTTATTNNVVVVNRKRQRKRRYAHIKEYNDNDDDNDSDPYSNNNNNKWDDSSSSDDDDNNNNNERASLRRKEQQRDTNLYGSFLNDDDDDDDDQNDYNVRNNKNKKKKRTTNNSNNFRTSSSDTTTTITIAPPIFVTSSVSASAAASAASFVSSKVATTTTTTNNDNIDNENNNNNSNNNSNNTIDQSSVTDPSETIVDNNNNNNNSSSNNNNNRNINDVKFQNLLQKSLASTSTSTTTFPNKYTTGTNNTTMNQNTTTTTRYRHEQQQQHQQQKFQQQQQQSSSLFKLGTWEKHTKGIGMKLLMKMGYNNNNNNNGTGSTTNNNNNNNKQQQDTYYNNNNNDQSSSMYNNDDESSSNRTTIESSVVVDTNDEQQQQNNSNNNTNKRKQQRRMGITVPVQVKVRPTNLGLGYGNFKEVTSIRNIDTTNTNTNTTIMNDLYNTNNNNNNKTIEKRKQQRQYSKPINDDDYIVTNAMSTMQQQLWKRYNSSNKHSQQQEQGGDGSRIFAPTTTTTTTTKTKPTIVPYTQLLSSIQSNEHNNNDKNDDNNDDQPTSMKILDLRGPIPSTILPMDISSSMDNTSAFINNNDDDDIATTENDIKNDTSSSSSILLLLGDELLHIVTQYCSSYAYQVQYKQYEMNTIIQHQQDIIQQQYNMTKQSCCIIQEKIDKLQHIIHILNQIETIISTTKSTEAISTTINNNNNNYGGGGSSSIRTAIKRNTNRYKLDIDENDTKENRRMIPQLLQQIHDIYKLIPQLLDAFTIEEREQLQLSTMFIPNHLFGTIIQNIFKIWNPFDRSNKTSDNANDSDDNLSELILRSMLLLNNNDSVDISTTGTIIESKYDIDLYHIRVSILKHYMIPKLQILYNSTYWDPTTILIDTKDIGLYIYELLIQRILQPQQQPEQQQYQQPNTTVEANNSKINIIPRTENVTRTTATTTNVDHNTSVFMNDDILFPSSSTTTIEKVERWDDKLIRLVQKKLIPVIYNKLLHILNHTWKPFYKSSSSTPGDDTNTNSYRFDLWILPWLPHIATTDISYMSQIVSDCKRNVKNTIQYLSRTIAQPNDDHTYITTCYQSLRPWIGILKIETLHNIVSTSILPRLIRYLTYCTVNIEDQLLLLSPLSSSPLPDHTNWTSTTDVLFQYHCIGLLSDIEFLSLMEGEVLSRWADAMYRHILSLSVNSSNNVDDVTVRVHDAGESRIHVLNLLKLYSVWKAYIFNGRITVDGNDKRSIDLEETRLSHKLLQYDKKICECFYSILILIRTFYTIHHKEVETIYNNNYKNISNIIQSTVLQPYQISGYRMVHKRRKDSIKQAISDDLLRMNLSGVAGPNGNTNNNNNNNSNNNHTTKTKTKYGQQQYDTSAIETHIKLSSSSSSNHNHSNNIIISFRDVVTEYANEHDIIFQPRTNNANGSTSNSSSSTTIDGKTIYVFGTIPIYLDQNMIYAYLPSSSSSAPATTTSSSNGSNKVWQPISLHDLALLVKKE